MLKAGSVIIAVSCVGTVKATSCLPEDESEFRTHDTPYEDLVALCPPETSNGDYWNNCFTAVDASYTFVNNTSISQDCASCVRVYMGTLSGELMGTVADCLNSADGTIGDQDCTEFVDTKFYESCAPDWETTETTTAASNNTDGNSAMGLATSSMAVAAAMVVTAWSG